MTKKIKPLVAPERPAYVSKIKEDQVVNLFVQKVDFARVDVTFIVNGEVLSLRSSTISGRWSSMTKTRLRRRSSSRGSGVLIEASVFCCPKIGIAILRQTQDWSWCDEWKNVIRTAASFGLRGCEKGKSEPLSGI